MILITGIRMDWGRQGRFLNRGNRTETLRKGDREFASVFKTFRSGGPISVDDNLPGWRDPRSPGNSDPNETAKSIMNKWTPDMVKRFRIFMDYMKDGRSADYGPWVAEWLDKTAPGLHKDRESILKCKMELIRRILKIKAGGCETLEDWCLFFLYHDRYLHLPPDIETLVQPETSKSTTDEWFNDPRPERVPLRKYFYVPARDNVNYPANMALPGLTDPLQGDDYFLADGVTPRARGTVNERTAWENLDTNPAYYVITDANEANNLRVPERWSTFPAGRSNHLLREHEAGETVNRIRNNATSTEWRQRRERAVVYKPATSKHNHVRFD